MKIKEVQVYKTELKLKEPFRIAPGASILSRNVIVKILTDENIVGIGEGSPSKRVCNETVETNIEFIKAISKDILNLNIFNLEKLREIFSKYPGNPSAKTAFETAVLDIIGKVTGQPIYKLLGGYRNFIETDITLSIKSPEEMAKDAIKAVEKGFRILKVKLGVNPVEDVERIKKIREAVGDKVKIRIDANEGWDRESALWVLDKISEYNIEFCEQPLPAHDLEGLKILKREEIMPIMADESMLSLADLLKLIEEDAVDYVNIKLMKCGGLTAAVDIAHTAETVGVKCMIGCMGESLVGITAGVHVAQALRNIVFYDLDADLFLAEKLVKRGGATIEKSIRKVGDTPGLGVLELRQEKLELVFRKER